MPRSIVWEFVRKEVFVVPPPVGSRRCVYVHYGYILEISGHSPASRETYCVSKLNMVSCQDRRPPPHGAYVCVSCKASGVIEDRPRDFPYENDVYFLFLQKVFQHGYPG